MIGVHMSVLALLFQDVPGQEVRLPDIIVQGRPLREATADFVGRVAALPPHAGPATWDVPLCVGVANLRRDAAEGIVERIGQVAERLDVPVADQGCEPRVFIAFTNDADGMARDMVAARRDEFLTGASGSTLGRGALEAFQASDRPIRWWHVSLPVNQYTGLTSRRLPQQEAIELPGRITAPYDFPGPNNLGHTASRLRSVERDDLSQVVIIVDVERLNGVPTEALADYLAFIALAQVDPDVEAGGFDSILGLFEMPPGSIPGLTEWDEAFLTGLYGAERIQEGANARRGAVADAMAQRVRRQRAEAPHD